MRLAYLCSRYPAISHTFVLREVEALRARGVKIETFSVRRTGHAELLAAADRRAFASTHPLLPPRPATLAVLLARMLSKAGWWRTLSFAVRRTPASPRDTLWQVFYLVEAALLLHACRRRGLDHVHVHFANAAADVALLAARLSRELQHERPLSFSFTMHGAGLDDPQASRLAEKIRAASFVVCISEFTRRALSALVDVGHREKLHVIRCGIDPTAFVGVARRHRETASVLCVGRLVECKGHAVLLEAIANLRRRGTTVRAVLAGDGPARASLERMATDLGVASDVTFAGAVGQDDIRALYACADVFCLPSFREGVPVALMEAMAMEVPVVTTPVGGIPELVEHDRTGLLSAPGDVDALAEALAALAADPARRRRLGRAGRATVVERFDIGQTAAHLARLFARRLAWPTEVLAV